jgi:hypothetical protein
MTTSRKTDDPLMITSIPGIDKDSNWDQKPFSLLVDHVQPLEQPSDVERSLSIMEVHARLVENYLITLIEVSDAVRREPKTERQMRTHHDAMAWSLRTELQATQRVLRLIEELRKRIREKKL